MATLSSTGRFAAGEACADNDILYGPYATIAAAHAALLDAEQNVVGRTVGILTGNTIEEYWYQGGTEQANLVKKQSPEVKANPTGEATTPLNKIKIGDTNYNIPQTDISNLATKDELQQGLSGKQDTISDLQQIRNRADEGHTALQPKQSGQYVENNFASFDANGGIKNSGCNEETFIKGVQQNGVDLTKDANGKVNVTVQNGKSAYDLYVDGGGTLTQEQWLASLKANIGAFQFITPTDTTAEAALTTIGSTYASAIGGVSPLQSTLSVILLMNDSNNTKTMMIATQETSTPGIYEFVYAGDLQSAMPSNVLTEDDIDNSFAGGSDKVASAEEVKELREEINGLTTEVTSKNLLNPSLIVAGKRVKSDGTLESVSISTYGIYSFIHVKPNTTYHVSSAGDVSIYGTTNGYIGFYETDDPNSVIQDNPAVDANTTSFTTPSNCHYIRISFTYADLDEQQLEESDSRTEYQAWFEPYIKIDSTKLTPIGHEAIGDGAVETNNLVDKSVTMAKLKDTVLKTSKNLLNPALQIENKRLNSSGVAQKVTSAYGIYDYIKVEPETTYHISNANDTTLYNSTSGYICFYSTNETTGFISSVDAKTTGFTTPAGCNYVRISFRYADLSDKPQLEEGGKRTEYEAWFEPHIVLDPSLITIGVGAIGTEQMKDGCVSQSKLTNPLRGRVYARYDGFAAEDTLNSGGSLETEVVHVTKNVRVIAYITGQITDSILIGNAYQGQYGRCVEVTPTQVIVKKGTNLTTDATYEHNLTLGNITTVIIDKTCSSEVQNQAVIRIINDYGDVFEQQVLWPTVVGKAFVKNQNAASSVTVKLSFLLADLCKKIWMFGDSYVAAIQDAPKWTHYLMTFGYGSFLLDARPGENSTEGLDDFNTILSTGAMPTYAVWLHGMNGGSDSNNSVNTTWLEKVTSFLGKCDELGIIPILSTIPTVPNYTHTKLNEWVRNSGRRYIDIAAAVEVGDGITDKHWRGWGDDSTQLLSSDEIHPTSLGAKVIVSKVLSDFSEITILT